MLPGSEPEQLARPRPRSRIALKEGSWATWAQALIWASL